MEFFTITLKREQSNGKWNNMHETTIYAYQIILSSSRDLLGFQDFSPLWLYTKHGRGIFSFPHTLRSILNRNPPKSLFSNPLKKSYRIFPLRKIRRKSFSILIFFSFIVPDLQPSKPLRFSFLQALERAPINLGISFPINSPPHFPCKLIIFSFHLLPHQESI